MCRGTCSRGSEYTNFNAHSDQRGHQEGSNIRVKYFIVRSSQFSLSYYAATVMFEVIIRSSVVKTLQINNRIINYAFTTKVFRGKRNLPQFIYRDKKAN